MCDVEGRCHPTVGQISALWCAPGDQQLTEECIAVGGHNVSPLSAVFRTHPHDDYGLCLPTQEVHIF